MVDPVSNEAASKIAEAQQTSDASQTDAVSGSDSSDGPSFQEVLDEKQGSDEPSAASDAAGDAEVGDPERVERADLREVDDLGSASGETSRPVKLEQFVESISEDKQEIDQMLERSLDGRALDQKQLLEMQALIYSYSKKVELTSKVVEKGTGGLKQMMQMRV